MDAIADPVDQQNGEPASASRTMRLYLIPVLLLLALTCPHLEQGDFRRDTVRYGAISLYMWESGSLLVPRLTPDRPYFNKPPMAFWIHGVFLKTCGASLLAARLPSILAAVGVVVFSMLTVRNLGSRREAVVSGIVLATTYEFFRRTREISLDLWQLFFVMVAVWLVSKGMRDRSRLAIVLCGIPLGCALLCKPLIALGAFPVFTLWVVASRRTQLLPWLGLALIAAVAVAAPWHLYIWHEFGVRFIRQYFLQEMVQRATRTNQGSSPAFYLVETLTTYWPWLLPLVYGVYVRFTNRKGREPARDLVLLGGVWIGFALSGLSIFADRKPNYALPIYPMMAWIAAFGLCRIRWDSLRRWYEHGLPWLAPGTVALSVAAALAPITFQQPPEKNWAALIDWIKIHQLDPAQFGYKNIDVSDVEYVYLKTGRWMQVLGPDADRPSLVVEKINGKSSLPAGAEPLFSSGPVYLLRFKK